MTLFKLVNLLVIAFGFSEALLAILLRSRAHDARASDRGSLRLLWITNCLAMAASFWLRAVWPHPLPGERTTYLAVAAALMVLGMLLRWAAIFTLRRAFTVNVAIAHDQKVVTAGLYGVVRHPSYTGLLLIFAGAGLSHGDALSLLVTIVPVTAALLFRIRVEEEALTAAFGAEYAAYAARTKRLIPGVW